MRRQRGTPRLALVALILLPLVWLSLQLDRPIMASTFASTIAVACAAPARFRDSWARVGLAYLGAVGVSAAVAYPAEAVGCPEVAWASVAAGMIALSTLGRIHAPTACVPFALIGAQVGSSLTTQLFVVIAGAAWTLAVLRCLPQPSPSSGRTPESDALCSTSHCSIMSRGGGSEEHQRCASVQPRQLRDGTSSTG